MSNRSYKYRAFITYAHKDEERARWLRQKLEAFRVPKHLIGTDGDFGVVPSRLFPIFRDRDELAGAAQLGPLIEQALEDSSHLIVLCSPQAVHSRWVNEEIRMFKAMGKADRVLCLVLSGNPMVSDLNGDTENECIPLAARREVDKKGLITDQKHEPAAADLRESSDGEKDALLKIVAGLLGLGLDDIKQRDLLARQKRLVRVASVSALMAISAIGLAVYAFYQQQQASLARANAEEERKLTEEELAKTQAITSFVQNLFFSLNPQNTAVMDTELIKTMLDQGSVRASELSAEPEIEARIRLCLGKTYRSIRSYDKAQVELQRVLELFEKLIAKETPARMQAMKEIAMVHDALGNYVEAQPMLRELLEKRSLELGLDHEDVIDTQIDLAQVYRRIGKIDQAEDACSKSLSRLNDQNRSDDDPLLLKCMSELAMIYLAGEKLAQGESLARNVYEKSRIRYGDIHASSLRVGQILVEALRKGEKLNEAEDLSIEVVEGLERILGESHPDTLGASDSLARILTSRGEFDEALRYYLAILSAKEKALGTMHPETLSTLKATAETYRNLERLNEAEETQIKVRNRLEDKHGREHPETLRSMNDLADLYLALGKEDEAFHLSEETLAIEQKVMGEQDPMTLKTMFRIGKLQYLFNNADGAMEILGDTLDKQEKLLGYDHAEATLTRDLLNEILAEKATTRVTVESNESMVAETSETSLIDFLDEFEKREILLDKNFSTRPPGIFDPNQSLAPPSVTVFENNPKEEEEEDEEGEGEEGFFKSLKNRLLPGKSDKDETDSSNPEQ